MSNSNSNPVTIETLIWMQINGLTRHDNPHFESNYKRARDYIKELKTKKQVNMVQFQLKISQQQLDFEWYLDGGSGNELDEKQLKSRISKLNLLRCQCRQTDYIDWLF